MKSSKDAGDGLDTPSEANDLYHMSSPDLVLTGKEKARAAEETPGVRDLEAERKRTGCTWGRLERLAHDWDAWRALVGSLCSSRGQRQ